MLGNERDDSIEVSPLELARLRSTLLMEFDKDFKRQKGIPKLCVGSERSFVKNDFDKKS